MTYILEITEYYPDKEGNARAIKSRRYFRFDDPDKLVRRKKREESFRSDIHCEVYKDITDTKEQLKLFK